MRLLRMPRTASFHSACSLAPRSAALRQCASASSGTKNGSIARPAEVLLREHDLLCAERLAVRLRGVLLVRAAVADVRAHDDERSARRSRLCAAAIAASIASRSFTSAMCSTCQPYASNRFARVVGEGEVGVAVDRDAVVVVEADELAELEVSGERRSFVRDAFHQVAVAADEVRVVIDDLLPSRLNIAARCASATAMPTALPTPWPSGPVVVSTPGVWPYSGMPRRAALPLPELLQVLEREVVAAEIQARCRAASTRARREHEAVAVRPVRIGGVVAHVPREQHVRERRERHRRAGVSRLCLLHRVHRERCGWC